MQACLFMATVALVIRGVRPKRASPLLSTAIGTTAALAMLTRMDSIVVVAPLLAFYAWAFLDEHGWRKVGGLAPAAVVPFAICGAWLTWKIVYYGSVLPNTYAAKVEGMDGLARAGLHFISTFVQAYAFYLPIACLFLGGWLAWERRLNRRIFAILGMSLVVWTVYVVRVGGDFMDTGCLFRFCRWPFSQPSG